MKNARKDGKNDEYDKLKAEYDKVHKEIKELVNERQNKLINENREIFGGIDEKKSIDKDKKDGESKKSSDKDKKDGESKKSSDKDKKDGESKESSDKDKKDEEYERSLIERYAELINQGYDVDSPELIEFYKEIAKERKIKIEQEKGIRNENGDLKYPIVPVNNEKTTDDDKKYEIVPVDENIPESDKTENSENKKDKRLEIVYDGKNNQYILKNYDKVAFMTACKLGEAVGVSESTVVRFANALGYSGYPKLQDALQEVIKNKLTTVQRVDMVKEFNDDSAILKKIVKSDMDNIKDTLEEIDEKAFEEAANRILKAKRIYIVGMRSSFTIAQYLGFYLGIILDSVHVIRTDMGDAFEQVVKINEDDVLIAISFPRYSKKSYQIVSYAKEKGAHIVSLTDSPFAPVASFTDNLLLVKSNMVSFVDSLVPALSIANALIVSVGMKEKEDIKQHFDDLEAIWEKYSVYDK